MSDPGYIADHVERGDQLTVTLPDGTTREVVVLNTYPSGMVSIDFVDRIAEARHEETP